MPDGEPLLEMSGISKRFGAVQVLTDVDFEVYEGEIVALVGDNGAGKSTLIKAIAGIHRPESGTLRFEGKVRTIHTPTDATDLGVATVYQDLALCDNLDVVGNLYLGRETIGRGSVLIDEITMEHDTMRLMRQLSVSIPHVRTPVASLSGGQRQSVALARATIGKPRLLILDEPTAALGVTQTRQVLELIKRLREQGLGIVIISHNLVDVFEVADRIVVLRLGRRVATFEASETTADQVVAAMTGADQADISKAMRTEVKAP